MVSVAQRPKPPLRMQERLHLPVFMKEMRTRMRGLRAPLMIFITTAISIGVGLFIIMQGWDNGPSNIYSLREQMSEAGRNLFIGLLFCEAIICGLLAPAMSAGAISIEREQKTLEMLMLTRLSNLNIALGKLLSSVSFLLMILLCALPVAAVAFILGGVDPLQLIGGLGILLAIVLFFGAIGLACSSAMPRTASAVTLAYAICLLSLFVFPLAVYGIVEVLYPPTPNLAYFCCLSGIFAVLSLIPAVVFSVICGTILRRRLSLVTNLILWGICFIGGTVFTAGFHEQLHSLVNGSSNGEWIFTGNPVIALFVLVSPDDFFYASSTWLTKLFIPCTIAILVFGAWIALAITVGQLQKARKQ